MRVTSFLICDSAKVRPDGTFDVVNGGLSESSFLKFPALTTIACVLTLEIMPDEAGAQELEITLRDGNARKLQTWRYPFMLGNGQKGANLVINLRQARIPAAGEYLLDVRVNGKHLGPAKTLRAVAA
jgi:hypothetical protein